MRVKKSIYNAIANTSIMILRIVLMFVVRIVFVKTIGEKLLGVDSLLTNLLVVLSIANSGMSTAISYTLYKPLVDKDYDRISNLMAFYKKVYSILGVVLLSIGLLFMPFLRFIVTSNVEHLYLYYVICLLTTVLPYFIYYKESLLLASQNMYKSGLITGTSYVVMYLLRIVFLFLIPNFVLYLMIQLIIVVLQRILINVYITKLYKKVDFNIKGNIAKKEQKAIYKSAFSIFLDKLGYYLVAATDNIIISAIPKLGLKSVTIYTNYYSVTGAIDNILGVGIFSGITASFGDLAVQESKESQEEVFNIISFASMLIYGLFFVGFLILLTPFIKFCFGTSFGISYKILFVVCVNLYILGILKPLTIIKEATGNYVKDRYANLIQAFFNILLSIILGRKLGLFGIVLATLISYFMVPLWNRPYIAFKYIFKKSPINFYFKQLFYFVSILFIYFVCLNLTKLIVLKSFFISFIIKIVVITVAYFILISLIYFKTSEYKYLKKTFLSKILKRGRL